MFQHKGIRVIPRQGLIIIATNTGAIELDERQAHWLAVAAIPAALIQLNRPDDPSTDNSDAT